jgi:hypothetical protein
MRNLTDHIVEGDSANHQLTVSVMDEPGHGGAHHWYEISDRRGCFAKVVFQDGPVKEVGLNGVTHEALLAILIDRLECFQAGPFACEANAMALFGLRAALAQLQKRTRERIARGVEGTHNA